jgi:hypothetical protein
MKHRATTPQAAAFARLKRSIAKDRGLPIDSPLVQRLALLQAQHNRLAAKIVAGHAVPTSELLAIEEAMSAVSPADNRLTVSVEVCERMVGICPACKAEVPSGLVADAPIHVNAPSSVRPAPAVAPVAAAVQAPPANVLAFAPALAKLT